MMRAVAGTWFKIALSPIQVAAWHVSRLEAAFGVLFVAAGSPRGAVLFGFARDDGGEDLCFTPSASTIASALLTHNGGQPCEPPVDDGTAVLLIGHSADIRLLSS
jgi:hypothetical protein